MEPELSSVDKNRTRILLPTNNAPKILEFFLTVNTHNSRYKMFHHDECGFFYLFIYFFSFISSFFLA